MERIPHPSHALVQTSYHSASLDPLHLLSIRIPQQFYLLQDLLFLEVSDAYDLFSAIDVRAPDYGMRIGSGGDVDGDLGVGFCERGKEWRAEECAERYRFSESRRDGENLDADEGRDVLHALRAAPFVAVVEIEAFALEDECTYAILRRRSVY